MAKPYQGITGADSGNETVDDARSRQREELRPGFRLPMQYLYLSATGGALTILGFLALLVVWVAISAAPAWAVIAPSVVMAIGSLIFWYALKCARLWLNYSRDHGGV